LNSGLQMVFRRYGTLNAATVPLTDGQTPPGDQLSVTDFQAQIQWYGDFVTIKGCGDINKPDLIDLDLLAA
jgi:N4-gp56 family major capsid protein